jgi:hypothetical protein
VEGGCGWERGMASGGSSWRGARGAHLLGRGEWGLVVEGAPVDPPVDLPPPLLIRPKRISFPEHFCYCFFSNLCVLNATNTD